MQAHGKFNIIFFVDSKLPKINKVAPEDGDIVHGTLFTVEYDEDFLQSIALYWRENTSVIWNIEYNNSCPSGKKQKCSFNLDLNNHSGEYIVFYFNISDIISHTASGINKILIDSDAPVFVNINSPLEGQNYSDKRVLFDITLDGEVESLDYIGYEEENPKWNRLCRNCESYNKTKSLKDGQHNVTFMAIDQAGNNQIFNVSFLVDSKKPKINKISPEDGSVVQGTIFIVEYDEDFLQKVELFGTNGTGDFIAVSNSCPSGKKQSCSFDINLSSYDGSSVSFYFNISDSINTIMSEINTIFIDDTSPILTVNSPLNGANYTKSSILFNINISENALLEYKADTDTRWRKLCSDCSMYNQTKSFVKGLHTVKIRSTDRAENIDEETISFEVV